MIVSLGNHSRRTERPGDCFVWQSLSAERAVEGFISGKFDRIALL